MYATLASVDKLTRMPLIQPDTPHCSCTSVCFSVVIAIVVLFAQVYHRSWRPCPWPTTSTCLAA